LFVQAEEAYKGPLVFTLFKVWLWHNWRVFVDPSNSWEWNGSKWSIRYMQVVSDSWIVGTLLSSKCGYRAWSCSI